MKALRKRLLLIALLIPIIGGVLLLAFWDLPSARSQVVFTADGRLLGVTYESRKAVYRDLRIWDLTNRTKLTSIKRFFPPIRLSPDGKTLAIGTEEDRVKLVDVATGRDICGPISVTSWLSIVNFSPDGKLFVAGQENATVRILDARTGIEQAVVKTQPPIASVAISPDGRTLATGRATVDLWDVETGKKKSTLQGHVAVAKRLVFSPDGKVLASQDTSLMLWDVKTATRLKTLAANSSAHTLAFSQEGGMIGIARPKGELELIDAESLETICTLKRPGDEFWSLAFSRDGQTVAAGTWARTARTWDTQSGALKDVATLSRPWALSCGAVCLAMLAWSVAWVRSGKQDGNPYRPLIDLLLISGVAACGLLVRIWHTGSAFDTSRPAVHLAISIMASSIVLVAVWSVLGTSRWSLRLSGLIAGATVALAPLLLWKEFDWFVWEIAVGGLSLIGSLLIIFKLVRLCGFRVVGQRTSDVTGTGQLTSRQFPLLDVMLWTATAAVVVFVVQGAKPTSIPSDLLLLIVTTGVALAVVGLVASWAALGSGPWVVRLLGLAGVAGVAASIHPLYLSSVDLYDPHWHVALPVLVAVAVAASLTIFRYHGYYLDRVFHPPPFEEGLRDGPRRSF